MNGTNDDFYLLNGTYVNGKHRPNNNCRSRSRQRLDFQSLATSATRKAATNCLGDAKRVKQSELHVGDVLEIADTRYLIDSRARGLWERFVLTAKAMMLRERS